MLFTRSLAMRSLDDPVPDALPVSEVNARKILERAIQIDTDRAGETTVGELRKIAEELNISSAALMQAVREVQSPAAIASQPGASGKRSWVNRTLVWVRTAMIGWAGLVSGFMVTPESSSFVAIVTALVAAAIGLAILDQGIKTQKSTLRDVFILFIGFFIGWARLNDPFSNDGSIWFLLIGGMTAVTGIILVQRIEWPWKKRLKQVFFPALRE
jgi:hypothetical protein